MVVLGNDLRAGQRLQMTVHGGVWKASQIPADGEHGFRLVSEAVSPGFEYADMTLANRDELLKLFPQHEKLIRRLSHADMPWRRRLLFTPAKYQQIFQILTGYWLSRWYDIGESVVG